MPPRMQLAAQVVYAFTPTSCHIVIYQGLYILHVVSHALMCFSPLYIALLCLYLKHVPHLACKLYKGFKAIHSKPLCYYIEGHLVSMIV